MRTTGTGASGEILETSPNQYRSSITSPTTSTRAFRSEVGRAPQALVLVIDEDHRHGCLGRDPGDFAEPVPVEHHVAYDQHPRLRRVGGFQGFLPMAKYSRPCARTAAGS